MEVIGDELKNTCKEHNTGESGLQHSTEIFERKMNESVFFFPRCLLESRGSKSQLNYTVLC